MVVGTVLLLLLSFVGRVATARHLSVEAFGDFNLGLSFAGLLSLVALFGLHQAVARSLAENPDPAMRRRLIEWTAVVTAVMAALTSALVYFTAPWIAALFEPGNPSELTPVFQLFSVTVGLTLLCTFIASIFQGFEDTIPFAWINSAVQPAAFIVFLYLFFAFHLTLTAALLAWVISNVVTFLALVVYAWRRLPQYLKDVPPAKNLPPGLLTLSLALWGVTTLVYVTGYVDTLILGAFRPESQVGLYSAVLTLGRLILVGSGAVTYIFLPVSARLKGEGNIQAIRDSYVTTSRWTMIFTVPLFLVFALLPTDSVGAVFGASYTPAAFALAIVSLSALVSVAFGPVNATLAGLAMTRPLLVATAASAVSNVVLSFALIPPYGLLGAAIAWSVARMVYPAAGALALYRVHGVTPLRKSYTLPVAFSLVVGVPVFFAFSMLGLPYWVVYPLYFVGLLLVLTTIFATRTVEEGDFVVLSLAESVLGRPLPRAKRLMEKFLIRPAA